MKEKAQVETNLYRKYRVKIKIRDTIHGGIPRNDSMIEDWLESRQMEDAIETTKAEIDIVEETEKAWCGFKIQDGKSYLESRNVKALIKESCTVLKLAKISPGLKQLLQHGLFVKPERLPVEVTGWTESVAHVMGPRGPRSCLKRNDYATGTVFDFEVWIVNTHPDHLKQLPEDSLRLILEHGQELGLGANRSQGCGKFDLMEFAEI